MPIKPSSAKDKGRRLQQMVCAKISDLIGLPWGQDQPIESRPMGQSGTDVRLDSEAIKLFPFSVECKWQENWSVPSWIEQAQANQIPGTHWMVVAKRRNKDPVVIISLDVFFKLLSNKLGPMRRTR